MVRTLTVVALLGVGMAVQARARLETENVVLVTLDGLRWQEVFSGADEVLIDHDDFVGDPSTLRQRFWSDSPEARREKLLPFCWSVLAKEGQIYGNRVAGSRVNVSNRRWFSYPGYNEILTGRADDRIDSNAKVDNVNVTVLERLYRVPRFRDSVAVFGSWDVFPSIVNETRSGIPVNAGFRTATGEDITERERFLNEIQPQTPSPWTSVRLDVFTHHYALEYVHRREPRVLYVAYGETDDFAHDGRYDAYLAAARRSDAFLADLWTSLQSRPRYRGTTTMIVTTDHGRGTEPIESWTSHGTDVGGSDQAWLAVIGPDTPALGEIRSPGQIYLSQVANTLATLLGLPYPSDQDVGAVIEGVIQAPR